MDEKRTTDSRTFVSGFARGLRVIEAFGAGRPRMSLGDVSAATGFDRAVARRLLSTLVELGYARLEGRVFELTPQILRLGYAFLSSHGLGSLLGGALDSLSLKISETVSVSVMADLEVKIIARSNAAGRHVTSDIGGGTSLPLHASAAGRVLLSSLDDDEVKRRLDLLEMRRFTTRTVTDREQVLASIRACRQAGYLVSDQELEDGLLSASVPIRDRFGNTIASLNVSSHSSRMTAGQLERKIVPELKIAAKELGKMMP
jgi:IclR family pca regulon transcriptional regulator